MTGQMLKDETERKAALGTGRSFHIEAPAGSGKTLLLTRRFVALLGEVNHPREILALTFTDKAAGEMRNRILHYLRQALAKEPPARDEEAEILTSAEKALAAQHRYLDTLMTSDGLNIMTFHGFCNYLIRRAPVEAGVSPDVQVIDETAQPLLIEEALQRTMDDLFTKPRDDERRLAFERRLLHHNNNWQSISQEMRSIVKERHRIGDLVAIVQSAGGIRVPSLGAVLGERLRRYIENRLAVARTVFSASRIGASWPSFIEHLASRHAPAAGMLPPRIPGAVWDALPTWQALAGCLLTTAGQPRKKPGPKAGFYSGFGSTDWAAMIQETGDEAAAVLHAVRNLPLQTDPVTDEELLSDFIICAAEVVGVYETLCRERSVIDFAGLEEKALRVLDEAGPSELYLSLDHRIRHLLIDEFQDTDRRQWELVKKLCAGWESGDGRTLFIVGDPKQSIYAFRNAEVRLFTEARDGIPRPGEVSLALAPLTLTTNFRSSETLIDWVNTLFGNRVMASPDNDADEVAFGASVACGEKEERTGTLSLDLFADEDRGHAAQSEARWLAHKVRRLLNEGEGGLSIAILLFTRNRLPLYLTALKDAQIPVQVEEGLLLADRPEVMHLLQMARMLAFPHDDLAWASLIRSPWCWFDAKTLFHVASFPAESWSRKLHLAVETIEELGDLLRAVDTAQRRVGRDHLGRVVKRLWSDCGGAEMTARRYGMSGVANCMRFFEILEQCEKGTPQETLACLKWIMDTAYEPVDPTTSRSPVHMMTVHRAKGLEFDFVFLPFMDWKPLGSGPRMPPPYLIERLPATDGSHFIAMGTDRRTGLTSKTYSLLKTLEKNRRWGEAKRLFYVAATRAKRGLSMSAALAAKEGEIAIPDRSILRWVTDECGCGDAISGVIERPGNMISIALNPSLPPADMKRTPHISIPPPCEIEPERIPREIETPSLAAGKAAGDAEATSAIEETLTIEQLRGTVIHRLVAAMITGGIEPSGEAVTLALAREGVPGEKAREMAAECLGEARKTVRSAFISDLVGRAREPVRSEWAMEDEPRQGVIRSGSADLAVYDGSSLWIVDFKTGRPMKGESDEACIARHRDLHEQQMKAYSEMAVAVTGVAKTAVRFGIYLTALQKWVEIS